MDILNDMYEKAMQWHVGISDIERPEVICGNGVSEGFDTGGKCL